MNKAFMDYGEAAAIAARIDRALTFNARVVRQQGREGWFVQVGRVDVPDELIDTTVYGEDGARYLADEVEGKHR